MSDIQFTSRGFGNTNKSAKNKSFGQSRVGQAAIEYILVIVVTASIFATMFWAIRRNLFELWVCYLGPKVQSIGGCARTIDDCWDSLGGGQAVDNQRGICNK